MLDIILYNFTAIAMAVATTVLTSKIGIYSQVSLAGLPSHFSK